MSTSEFDKYKVDHLFLLIGENPLPNYVAAKTLLAKDGKPYLVFTEHTQKPAERLKDALGLSDKEMVPLDNNESNPCEIKKRIRAKVEEIQDKSEKKQFGLNYTGGTKAMAVHAYQALLQPKLADPTYKLNPEPKFSYLDSRNLKMLIDQPTNPVPLDIPKDKLDFSLDKLFKLHGFTLSKTSEGKAKIKTNVTLPELVDALVNHQSEWQTWCSKVLRLEARKKIELGEVKNSNNAVENIFELGGWKNATELKNLSLSIQELPEEITDILKRNNIVDDRGYLSIQQIEKASIIPKPKKNNEYPEDICTWLEGVWLEDYVLRQLEKIKKEKDGLIDEVGMSFDFDKKSNVAEFEFDVAFLRGYQLFALSCTTDTKPGLCKLKLFEAYRRAKQLGGDEARVALVCFCCSGNTKKIQNDFLAQVNDPKVKIFGINDLASISESLATWIKEVDQ